MNKFGFNINLKMSPGHIEMLGEEMLGSGLYEAVEVTYYGHMEHTNVTGYNQAVRSIVEKYHPQVTVHIPAYNLTEENHTLREAISREIESCLDYTLSLGGREMIMHAGYHIVGLHVPNLWGDKDAVNARQRQWNLSVEIMQKACDMAAERNMMIYTENLSTREITVTCTDLKKYLRDVDRENLKIVFDIGHSFYTGNDIPKEVEIAGNDLRHLHLHDNMGNGDQHLCLGDGGIEYGPFFDMLKKVGYPGLYMMELGYCTPENLKRSRELIQSLV